MGIFSIDENKEYIALEKNYQEITSKYNNLVNFLADCYPEVLKEWKGENQHDSRRNSSYYRP